jgi:hypothetical protein
MLIGPGAGPTGTSRATTELHGAVRSDTAGPCAGCAAVASTGTMIWARAAGATRRSSMIHHHRSMQALGTIGPHPAAHRPRVWRETLWAREVWGPHRLSGHTGRERAVSPWEEAPRSCASVQDSERTYASTHVYLGTSRPGPAAPPRARKRTVGCERAGGAARLGAGATAATRRVVDACTSRHHRAGTGRETIWPREVWGQ